MCYKTQSMKDKLENLNTGSLVLLPNQGTLPWMALLCAWCLCSGDSLCSSWRVNFCYEWTSTSSKPLGDIFLGWPRPLLFGSVVFWNLFLGSMSLSYDLWITEAAGRGTPRRPSHYKFSFYMNSLGDDPMSSTWQFLDFPLGVPSTLPWSALLLPLLFQPAVSSIESSSSYWSHHLYPQGRSCGLLPVSSSTAMFALLFLKSILRPFRCLEILKSYTWK